jgi:hypothetical protein
MSKTILIACFSLLFLTGCNHVKPIDKVWVIPAEPNLEQPHFQREGDRLYLDKEDSVLLRNNILELKAYQEKLTVLIEEMKKYYKGK